MQPASSSGAPASPIGQVTIRYTLSDVVNILNINSLAQYHWIGSARSGVGSDLNPVNRTIVATIAAAGTYAVLGQGKQFVYIPLITR